MDFEIGNFWGEGGDSDGEFNQLLNKPLDAIQFSDNKNEFLEDDSLLDEIEDEVDDTGKGRRDFGVDGKEFADALEFFPSKDKYMKVGVKS